uniref:cytochrome b n=1 Tax=Castellaniella defragrans TaxID=75697 RepID=UPI0033424D77
MTLRDSRERYGAFSRFLHWGMALLIAYEFVTAITHALAKESALDNVLWATHRPLGLLLLILMVLRVVWAFSNARQRPEASSVLSWLGHVAMYGLILLIPILALMRQYGSGRAFSPFGLPLMSGFEGEQIKWLMAPARMFHGLLGWVLLALIVGHVIMTLVHRYRPGDRDVLPRMLGK